MSNSYGLKSLKKVVVEREADLSKNMTDTEATQETLMKPSNYSETKAMTKSEEFYVCDKPSRPKSLSKPLKKEVVECEADLSKNMADTEAIQETLMKPSDYSEIKAIIKEEGERLVNNFIRRLELSLFNFSREKTEQEKALEVLVKCYQAEQIKSSKQIMSLVILSAVMLFCVIVMLFKMR